MRKAHAIHNESTCNLLYKNGGFNDWVVTTAYYSSIHFVYHRLFPLQKGKILYQNFDEYYTRFCSQVNYNRKCKHTETVKLVYNELRNIGSDFKGLKDLCHTARYNDYNISIDLTNKAVKRLHNIKKVCLIK